MSLRTLWEYGDFVAHIDDDFMTKGSKKPTKIVGLMGDRVLFDAFSSYQTFSDAANIILYKGESLTKPVE